MKLVLKYILSFIVLALSGLFIFDLIFLPIFVDKNSNLYLPDYRGLNYKIVEKKLDSLGFVPKIVYDDYSIDYIPYNVIKMSPRPFTKLKTGRIIKVTVASDKKDILLTDYKGFSLRNTKLIISRLDLSIDTLIYEYSNKYSKDFIISQFPKEGKILKSEDKMTFIVSLGNPPNYYITPNLINQNLSKAKETISKAGLLLGKITYEYNSKYLNNTILEQSKTAGMRLSFPTKIDLIVSKDTN